MIRQRFAPSPTGLLHLGHAFSALTAYEAAQKTGGAFLLRIEDIDLARCKPAFEAAIFEDLDWLGLVWEQPVLHQSNRLNAYGQAIENLTNMGLCYPCCCTRKDIASALTAPQEGGVDGVLYPKTCMGRMMQDRSPQDAVRLDMDKAIAYLGGDAAIKNLTYIDQDVPVSLDPQMLKQTVGDIVLARKDIGTSYHIAVVVDDAHQGITHVTRGLDLQSATPLHRLLQALLDLPTPQYYHHRLIRDAAGKRLAKRDDARAIRAYRDMGKTPTDIRAMVGLD